MFAPTLKFEFNICEVKIEFDGIEFGDIVLFEFNICEVKMFL